MDICDDLLATLGGEVRFGNIVLEHLRESVLHIGVDEFLEIAVDVTTEVQFLMKTQNFMASLHKYEDDSVRFNLPAFVNVCVDLNPDFSFRYFLKRLRFIQEDQVSHERIRLVLEVKITYNGKLLSLTQNIIFF